jgi:flagellar basal body-associated protein FliL
MSKRMLVIVLALVVLAAVGAVVYTYSTSKAAAAAEDCAEKPKPKNEFAMAAECDTPGAAAPGQTAPAAKPVESGGQ